MRKRNGGFLGALIALLAIFIFFGPSYGWKLRGLLSPAGGNNPGADASAENETLKAEVAKLQNIASELPQPAYGYISAVVYSSYPMNFKNEILVGAGKNQGIVLGKAVLFEGVLLGKVEKVFDDTSLVQTVFDSGFQAPVRIGASAYDSLLKGGPYPKATLISKKAKISGGDAVYSASPNFPYGLPMGEINSVGISADNVFQEATLGFAYDMNQIRAVLVIK